MSPITENTVVTRLMSFLPEEREHARDTHSMHGFQELHTELILDQLGLNGTEEN